MSAHRPNHNEIRAAEAEYERLTQVRDVLSDIRDAADDVERAEGFRSCRFELDRSDYAMRTGWQVGEEGRAAWDRVLVARHGKVGAAEIWAAAKASAEQRLEQIRQERSRPRDIRRSR